MSADFSAAGERLLSTARTALQGVLVLDEKQADDIKYLGAWMAEVQLMALTDPERAKLRWPILEAALEQWKQVVLGRSEAARLRMRSAILEFLGDSLKIVAQLAGKVVS